MEPSHEGNPIMSESRNWLRNVQEQVAAEGWDTTSLLEALDQDPAAASKYVKALDHCREKVPDLIDKGQSLEALSAAHLRVLGQDRLHFVYACLILCRDWQPIDYYDWTSIEEEVAEKIVWVVKEMDWDPGWEIRDLKTLLTPQQRQALWLRSSYAAAKWA